MKLTELAKENEAGRKTVPYVKQPSRFDCSMRTHQHEFNIEGGYLRPSRNDNGPGTKEKQEALPAKRASRKYKGLGNNYILLV